MAVASRLGVGFVPIRKKGKLPGEVVRQEYTLEYGTDIVEIEKCSLTASGSYSRWSFDELFFSDKVVLIDDLIATGGTMKAAVKLIGSTEASLLGALCLIEIDFLKGKEGIDNFVSLIHV
jgi:adenine phosphoribosyltransferase